MPTIFTHAVVALAAGQAAMRRPQSAKFWVLAVTCSMLPDADVLGFTLGIPYSHPLGHRGFFHSPFFGLLVGLAVTLVFFRDMPRFSRPWWVYLAFFSLVTASHGILDALTDGGLGIALLAPFDDTRHFFPWTPIRVSPIGIEDFFNARGWITLKSELLWIWSPLLLLAVVMTTFRAGSRRRRAFRTGPPCSAPCAPTAERTSTTQIIEKDGRPE